MKAPADKSPDNQRQVATHQWVNVGAKYKFVDNRAETADLRQLQEIAGNSPQTQVLAQLSAMMNSSPRSAGIHNLRAVTDNSPRLVAQRQKYGRAQGLPIHLRRNVNVVSMKHVELGRQHSVASEISLRHGSYKGGSTFQLLDNRPEAIVRRKQQRFEKNRIVVGAGQKQVVQRMLKLRLGTDASGTTVVKVSQSSRRPGTGLPGGSQGDHTTPFAVLQDQVKNAIAELTVAQAWSALDATYQVYRSLPGWPSLLKKFYPDRDDLEIKLAAGGDIGALNVAANRLLSLRQKIPFTNIPKGGRGQSEGYILSGIRQAERKLQLNPSAVLHKSVTRAAAMFDMLKAFDFKRVSRVKNAKRKKDILLQHCITIQDAYPLLSQRLGITSSRLFNHLVAMRQSKKTK